MAWPLGPEARLPALLAGSACPYTRLPGPEARAAGCVGWPQCRAAVVGAGRLPAGRQPGPPALGSQPAVQQALACHPNRTPGSARRASGPRPAGWAG